MYVLMFRKKSLYLLAASLGCDLYAKHFSVSPRVWKRISEVNQREGFPNAKRILRLAIESGGCHGYLYKFSFDSEDNLNSLEDIRISAPLSSSVSEGSFCATSKSSLEDLNDSPQLVIDKHTLEKLQNATIDFHSELKGSAFVVVGNELVDQSCACAMSFSVRKKKSALNNNSSAKLTDEKQGELRTASTRGTPIKR